MMTLSSVGFIKRIQELGFSLSEIYKLLGVVDKDEVRCQDMFEFILKNKGSAKTNRGFKTN